MPVTIGAAALDAFPKEPLGIMGAQDHLCFNCVKILMLEKFGYHLPAWSNLEVIVRNK